MSWLQRFRNNSPILFYCISAATCLLLLLFIYAASIGPAASLARFSSRGHEYVAFYYKPLLIVRHELPGQLADAIDIYIEAWSGEQCTWIVADFYPMETWHRPNLDRILFGRAIPAHIPTAKTYTYDPSGNRTLKNIDGTRTSYAYDAANQLRHRQDPTGRTTHTFDPNGNQQIEREPTGGRTTTIWDFENQPRGILLPNGNRVTYTYNAEYRRVESEE